MRVAVLGAGAMGGALAAHLARAGTEVTVVDVAEPVLEAIRADGIRISTDAGEWTAAVRAEPSTAGIGQVDVVVVFVKAQATPAAAAMAAELCGPRTVVVTLQNGWGNADVLAATVPADRLVIGVTYNSCTLVGPGQVRQSGYGTTFVGPYRPAGALAPAEGIATLLDAAGWAAEATSSVHREVWQKLVLNAATLPTAALTGLTAGALDSFTPTAALVDELAAEAVAVARAQDLDVELAERLASIHAVLRRAGDGKPSMLQDVLAGRKTEIETVNGAVVRAGDRLGVPVPLNRAMVALVGGLEYGRSR